MQNVQRHFGKYLKRSADDQQVSLLLKDFEDADQLLTKVRLNQILNYAFLMLTCPQVDRRGEAMA